MNTRRIRSRKRYTKQQDLQHLRRRSAGEARGKEEGEGKEETKLIPLSDLDSSLFLFYSSSSPPLAFSSKIKHRPPPSPSPDHLPIAFPSFQSEQQPNARRSSSCAVLRSCPWPLSLLLLLPPSLYSLSSYSQGLGIRERESCFGRCW